MAKRLSIPKTAGEAERFLWHVIEHIREVPPGDPQAEAIVMEAQRVIWGEAEV